jgi:hypothetical protein
MVEVQLRVHIMTDHKDATPMIRIVILDGMDEDDALLGFAFIVFVDRRLCTSDFAFWCRFITAKFDRE